jgi:hypothetical protein
VEGEIEFRNLKKWWCLEGRMLHFLLVLGDICCIAIVEGRRPWTEGSCLFKLRGREAEQVGGDVRLRGVALQRRRCRPGNGGERRQVAARFGA